MPTFQEELEAALDASVASDREIICAPTVKIDFATATVRLWGGIGSLITPDGERWVGYYIDNGDAEPQSLLSIPQIDDIRGGTSAPIPVTLGYLDAESYARLRDDPEETDGVAVTFGNVYLERGKTRALTQPGNATRLKIVGKAGFREARSKQEDGSYKVLYSITVKMVNLNAGRSRIGANVFTYNGHKFRSEIIEGVEDDEYAQFIARYAGGITLELI